MPDGADVGRPGDATAAVPAQLEALLAASRAQQELIRDALTGLLAVLAARGTLP